MQVIRKLSTDTLHIIKDRYTTLCGANHYRIESGFHIPQTLETMHYKPYVSCKTCLAMQRKMEKKGFEQ